MRGGRGGRGSTRSSETSEEDAGVDGQTGRQEEGRRQAGRRTWSGQMSPAEGRGQSLQRDGQRRENKGKGDWRSYFGAREYEQVTVK